MKNILLGISLVILLKGFSFPQEISWKLTNGPKNNFGDYLNVFAVGSTSNGNIFAGTNQSGVYKSTDMGETWLNCSDSLFINSIISYMAIDSNDIIYISSSSGLFRSSDEGLSWIQFNLGIPAGNYQSLAVNNNGLTFTGTYSGIYRSFNFGANWSFSGLDSCFVWVIKIYDDSTIVAGTFNYGPFISTDKGDSWASINERLNQNQIVGLAISETEKLFVGVTGGVYNSTDWGINWDQVLSISQVWVGVIFILNGQNIFAGSRGEGIFLSTDNGNNWNIINNGLKNFYVNAFCGSSNGYVYAGSDSGVFITSSPIVSINSEKSYLATGFSLFQNYPNPFNPTTKISWQSPVGSYQTLRIYDVLGTEVATLVNEYKPAGSYEVEFNGHSDGGQNLSSGVYFYQLRAGSFVETKKMLLTK